MKEKIIKFAERVLPLGYFEGGWDFGDVFITCVADCGVVYFWLWEKQGECVCLIDKVEVKHMKNRICDSYKDEKHGIINDDLPIDITEVTRK